jgi:hypothetical protein
MTATKALLRNLTLLGAVALGATLLSSEPASAAPGCYSQDTAEGWCHGCNYEDGCWEAVCSDGYEEYYREGCRAGPIYV